MGTALSSLNGNNREETVPMFGIAEWMCYHANYEVAVEGPEAIDRCIEKHLEKGVDHIVWNCGRSVVDYWSDLPNSTQMCEKGTRVGGEDWSFVRKVMDRVCPLSRAIEQSRRRGATLYGRLCMNRHYGSQKSRGVTSDFARRNPVYREQTPAGNQVSHKLSYGIEDVQQERLDILLEIQRIGVKGLVLDFCRQMPILLYHPSLVKPYLQQTGRDPRSIDSADPDDYAEWFQWRADVLTDFMSRLRQNVMDQERDLGRPCPVIARIPDAPEWLSVAFGLDVKKWCRNDLVDALMLSPFPLCMEDTGRHFSYHVRTAHEYGKPCIGGIGSRKLIKSGTHQNKGFYHPQPVYTLADAQYRAGVDAMSVYQSDTLVRMKYLTRLLKDLRQPRAIRRRLAKMNPPDVPPEYPIGLDWHAHPAYSLRGE
ncbi:MAG: hypothetical protein ACOCTQ_04495, partial [Planctomycetota bacterium]